MSHTEKNTRGSNSDKNENPKGEEEEVPHDIGSSSKKSSVRTVKSSDYARQPLDDFKYPQKKKKYLYPKKEDVEKLKDEAKNIPTNETENPEEEEVQHDIGSSSKKSNVRTKQEKKRKTEDAPKPEKKGEKSDSETHYWPWISAIIILILSIFGFIFKPSSTSEQLDITQLMTDMKNDFKGQPDMTFKIVQSAVRMANKDATESPGILILLASKEADEQSRAFASQLAKLASQNTDFVTIELDNFQTNPDVNSLKKNIDSKLKNGTSKVVLVSELHKIPFQAALLFHSYCDHENAPFKRVLYMMRVLSSEAIPASSEPKSWDVQASRCLREAWSDSDEGQVESLISRLTGHVALIVGKT